ncbi:MAG TPA: tRNA (adenosine(37)-N6)-threonylcarbamoyltransferase complex dimerization subunit type 1 TsaB [Acidobacteriota bacterium]|nr:tRNA (adenosine(37)-N6)-threonylcarbamoyltransferase complex dimerization subunit type 1 TsaB [Acidobacteriota bacterium]
MLILAVDTTTSSGSVALLEDRRLVGEIAGESGATHSARLLGAVDRLLRSESLAIADIGAFAVAAGPGSFTGIRIGLSTVKALAFASGKPVVPVSSLRALALKLALAGAPLVCPVLDAKKGEVYAALFENAAGRLVELIPQGAYAPDLFFPRLPAGRAIAFIGGGCAVYRDRIPARILETAVFPARTLFVAHEVGLLGLEGLGEGKGVPAARMEPIYFRRSQAEEKH